MAIVLMIVHVLGFFSSFHALMSTRTSQGTIAWIVSLNIFPLVSVPAYWVLGRNKFQGYVTLRRQVESKSSDEVETVRQKVSYYVQKFDSREGGAQVATRLAELPYLNSNSVKLLINGEETFNSILAGIDRAEQYILFQFYIVRDDALGRKLKSSLIAKAREGVNIWFLYDEIGTRGINSYLQDLRNAGVQVSSFHSTRGGGTASRLTFAITAKLLLWMAKPGGSVATTSETSISETRSSLQTGVPIGATPT